MLQFIAFSCNFTTANIFTTKFLRRYFYHLFIHLTLNVDLKAQRNVDLHFERCKCSNSYVQYLRLYNLYQISSLCNCYCTISLFYKISLISYYLRMYRRYVQGFRNVIIDRCIQIVFIKSLTSFENCTMTTKFAKYYNINRIQQQTKTNFSIASKTCFTFLSKHDNLTFDAFPMKLSNHA